MFYLNLQGAFIIAEPEDEDGLDAGYVSIGKIGNLWFSVICLAQKYFWFFFWAQTWDPLLQRDF